MNNSVAAKLRHARVSPQKARLVANMVRGQAVDKAIDSLTYSTKKAAGMVKKLLESALANAEHNAGLDIDELVIASICVDEAPCFKRFEARAKGRSNRITKRNCHITVEVAERQEK